MKPYYQHAGITIYHGDSAEVVLCLPGCVLHTIVTGGHIAWECRKGAVSGKWIW